MQGTATAQLFFYFAVLYFGLVTSGLTYSFGFFN
jgi:hypothetical protein